MFSRKRMTGPAAVAMGGVLLLTACGGNGQNLTGGSDGDAEDSQELDIALVAWEDGLTATALWEVILEEKGYDVNITEVDVAPAFQALDNGDTDLYLTMSLPVTHEEYWDDYGDSFEDLGPWYDNALRTLTVPGYMEDLDEISDLPDHADEFDNRIVGIDPGAGLTRVTEEEVMPGYGLDEDFELVTSSGAAMQAELDAAIAEEEPVLVTLWHPHPAYAQHDLKDLEDTEGHFGEADGLHAMGRDGFSEEYPTLAGWLEDWELTEDEFAELMDLVLREYEEEPKEGARVWLRDNPEFLERTLGEDAEGLEF